AVLKLSFPDNKEFRSEVEALRFYSGNGAVALLQEDLENGAVLLERAVPGARIGDVQPDSEQIHTVCEVLKTIHKPFLSESNTVFPTLETWSKAFERYRKKFFVS